MKRNISVNNDNDGITYDLINSPAAENRCQIHPAVSTVGSTVNEIINHAQIASVQTV